MIFCCLNQKGIILKPRLTQHSPTSHVATATVFDVHLSDVRRGQPNLCKKTEVIVLGASASPAGSQAVFWAEVSFVKAVQWCLVLPTSEYRLLAVSRGWKVINFQGGRMLRHT